MIRRFVTPEVALERIRSHFRVKPSRAEVIPLSEALSRVLAEDVVSEINVPSFDRSTVDGYAVRSADVCYADERRPVKLRIIGNVKAGEYPKAKVSKGTAVAISTGAPIPQGADSVIMVEFTSRERDEVEILRSATPGENILRKGGDIKAGEIVLRRFQRLGPAELGVLSAIGREKAKVFVRPKVAVISIGSELVEPGRAIRPGKIYDINRRALIASISECGCDAVDMGIVKDDKRKIKEVLKKALAFCDAIIASGSTSAGGEDILPALLSELREPGIIVEGLSTKPGKPTMVAIARKKIIFALPGHPASSLLTFNLIVRPILREMAGLSALRESTLEAYAGVNIFSEKGRRTYAMVRVEKDEKGRLIAHPIPAESGAITTLTKADGFIEIAEEREFIEKGEKVIVRLFKAQANEARL